MNQQHIFQMFDRGNRKFFNNCKVVHLAPEDAKILIDRHYLLDRIIDTAQWAANDEALGKEIKILVDRYIHESVVESEASQENLS